MAGWWSRIAGPHVDDADPAEQLELAYQEQLRLLAQARRSLTGVTDALSRAREQLSQAQGERETWLAQARRHVADGDDEAARGSLRRATSLETACAELTRQVELLTQEADTMDAQKRELERRVDEFRAGKETWAGSLQAAEAPLLAPDADLARTSRVEQELSMLKLERGGESRGTASGRYENPPPPGSPVSTDPELR